MPLISSFGSIWNVASAKCCCCNKHTWEHELQCAKSSFSCLTGPIHWAPSTYLGPRAVCSLLVLIAKCTMHHIRMVLNLKLIHVSIHSLHQDVKAAYMDQTNELLAFAGRIKHIVCFIWHHHWQPAKKRKLNCSSMESSWKYQTNVSWETALPDAQSGLWENAEPHKWCRADFFRPLYS